jgi:hypothetical protein
MSQDYRKQDFGLYGFSIFEAGCGTITTHFNHYFELVDQGANVRDFGIEAGVRNVSENE